MWYVLSINISLEALIDSGLLISPLHGITPSRNLSLVSNRLILFFFFFRTAHLSSFVLVSYSIIDHAWLNSKAVVGLISLSDLYL